jgi:hypothetical protein
MTESKLLLATNSVVALANVDVIDAAVCRPVTCGRPSSLRELDHVLGGSQMGLDLGDSVSQIAIGHD